MQLRLGPQCSSYVEQLEMLLVLGPSSSFHIVMPLLPSPEVHVPHEIKKPDSLKKTVFSRWS